MTDDSPATEAASARERDLGHRGAAAGSQLHLDNCVERVFPFYCKLDQFLRIVDVGPSLRKLCADDLVGANFTDHFAGEGLNAEISADTLRHTENELFIGHHRQSGVRLRGQVLVLEPPTDGFMIVWAPWFTSTEAFDSLGLSLADFGIQDPIIDMLYVLQALERAADEAAVPNRRLDRFFTVSPDLLLIFDPNGVVKLVNPAVTSLLGVLPGEFMSVPLAEQVHPEDRHSFAGALSDLADGRPVVDLDIRLKDAPAEWRWLRLSALADRDGHLIYATARDISASVEARELAALILASSPNGVLLLNEDGEVTFANARIGQMFGLADNQIVGQNIDSIIPDISLGEQAAGRASYLDLAERSARTAGQGRDLIGKTALGEEFPLQLALSQIRVNDRWQLLATVTDIRERKILEDELRATRDAAIELTQAKSDFIANTSHEIRTPLTSIIAASELLADTEIDENQREIVEILNLAGERMLRIVDEVLTFARLETSHSEIDAVPFNPAELLEECARIVRPAAVVRDIEVRVKTQSGIPDVVVADREKLGSILLNIVGNAVKFTDVGWVELRLSVPSSSGVLEFQIQDTGFGLPSVDVQDLFLPFVQADSSATRKYGGTGLGLAISKGLVETMGGQISARNNQGPGACFTVQIPLVIDTTTTVASGPTPPQSATATGPLAGLHVLLVEDDQINAGLISRMLIRLGAYPETAPNGAKALEWLAENQPDVVLMDCQMPVMDGFDATRALRRKEAGGTHLPVIAITASTLDENRDRCLAAGMDGVLSKPVQLAQLAAGLAAYVRRRN